MKYGLKENIIKNTNNIFAKYLQIEKAILYGSRAKGNFTNGSDIDLTLIGKNIDIILLQKIENDLEDLLLPYTFDISIYKHISNKNLLEHISRVGKIFYKNTKPPSRY